MMTHGDSVTDIIKSRYPGKPMVRPTYIGFDRELLSENSADDRYILCLGRIDVHMKGLDLVIAAFESISGRFPGYRLVFAGRGADDQISWMKNRIAASPVRVRIDLRLSVSAQEKAALLRGATFVCMPSRFEGWCIVAIEAAAGSKAALGTDIPGLRDTIQNGKTGLLVPPDDADALARGMATLLEDRDLRVRLGRAGYAWAQNFTWEKVAQNHEECYRLVLEQSMQ
jgi:glycosyltransferase involved in cell wall biosynthesis